MKKRIVILVILFVILMLFILIPAISAEENIPLFAVIFILFVTVVPFFAIMANDYNSIISTIKDDASSIQPQNNVEGVQLNCAKCNEVLKVTDKLCPNCGLAFDGNNVVVSQIKNNENDKSVVLSTTFDNIYSLSEDEMLEEFIKREMKKIGVLSIEKIITRDALKRKNILNIIFAFLIFILESMTFFHFPVLTYVIGAIILIIYFIAMKKYDLMDYLKKEIKSRPAEKISNILMNAKNSFVSDKTKKVFLISLGVALVLPLIIFYKPIIIYEKVDNGYAVRYYIYGLSNSTTATIPNEYKNKPIVSLRGNAFSNMKLLKSVKLPDTIVEIRGQAFKNCVNLREVNIPKKLEYLGGGAFYNAKLIKEIELPDTLTYLGGESFYGASSLEHIKLSKNLSEIRGSSFENCYSLRSVIIPDKVTRIGGHAFYGNASLSEVIITENSELEEIGSSAFRNCFELYTINIPEETYVNERAFKNSPTTINRYENNCQIINGFYQCTN